MPKIPNIELEDFDSLFEGESYDEDFFNYDTSMTKVEYPVQDIPLNQMHEFKNHPFKVKDDDQMQELMNSINEYGIFHPAIVREDSTGGYEIISGHRRYRACQRLGMKTMPARVVDFDDNSAVICMTDANFQQRDSMLVSEKAKAYSMKFEAVKNKHSKEGGSNLAKLGEKTGESGKTIQRYIRLASLSDDLLSLIDTKVLGFSQGVNLSYLDEEAQKLVYSVLKESELSMSRPQSKQIKDMFRDGTLDESSLQNILAIKKAEAKRIYLKDAFLKKYFPGQIKEEEIEKILIVAMEHYRAGD